MSNIKKATFEAMEDGTLEDAMKNISIAFEKFCTTAEQIINEAKEKQANGGN